MIFGSMIVMNDYDNNFADDGDYTEDGDYTDDAYEDDDYLFFFLGLSIYINNVFLIGKLLDLIISSFGSYEKFRAEFENAGLTAFGSGWVSDTCAFIYLYYILMYKYTCTHTVHLSP